MTTSGVCLCIYVKRYEPSLVIRERRSVIKYFIFLLHSSGVQFTAIHLENCAERTVEIM